MSQDLYDSLLPQLETQERMVFSEPLSLDRSNPEIPESVRFADTALGIDILNQDTSDSVMPQETVRPSYKSRNDQTWNRYKDEIRRFYIDEENTLEATMCRIAGKYGFKASERKWKLKMKEWNLNKYLPAKSMNIMIAKAEKRRRDKGKETLFLHNNSLIRPEKFENFKRRKTTKVVIELLSPTAKTPPDISYYTPSPQSPISGGTREYQHPASVGSVGELVQTGAKASIPEPEVEEPIALTARLRKAGTVTLSSIQLPFLVHGLETEGDRIFLHHYISRLSIIFTLEGEYDSAFRNILLPMAQQHSGLMHSILALSSNHLDYKSPYGLQILREHPSIDAQTLEERSQFHQKEAFKELIAQRSDVKVAPATYAQMICLILETLNDPAPNGNHRLHLQHYKKLIQENPPEEGEPMKFIHEFFQYHIHADGLIYFPQGQDVEYVSTLDDWNLPNMVFQPSAVRLLGVFDGLFLYMSRITNIRNNIRQNMELGVDPVVDYRAFYAAAEIDAGIREWTPAWPAGDPRDAAGMLYRQMMWIYLWRTIYPPQITNWKLDTYITSAVEDGIKLLKGFGARDPSQTLILAPAFVIGCAAFEEHQRAPIRQAIGVVKGYKEYKNSDTVLEVLDEVWRLMDAKDERSWDWQAVAHRMGVDFLAT